jgi:hypothetical protein
MGGEFYFGTSGENYFGIDKSLGSSVTNVSLGSVLLSGALGAVGQIGGATAARSAVSGLSNGAKGQIGETVARVGIAARGENVVAQQTRAGKVTELGNVTGRAAKSVPDFVVQGKDGAVKVVEAKFGTSGLTGAQKELKNQLGDAFSVVRTTADDVANAGGVVGGVAGGTKAEIRALKKRNIDPHELKPNSKYDLFKDKDGNIYVKPKDGSGPGEPTGINLREGG